MAMIQWWASTDYNSSDGTKAWVGVASNDAGTHLAACENAGLMWYSSDSGLTWTSSDQYNGRTDTTPRDWVGVAWARSGTDVVAAESSSSGGGRLWYSTSSGTGWTASTSYDPEDGSGPDDDARAWWAVASNNTGSSMLACEANGRIWRSADGGVNWVASILYDNFNGSHPWYSVDVSSTGQYCVACEIGGRIWYSTNYGIAWTSSVLYNGSDAPYSWYDVASDSSGTNLAAVEGSGIGGRVWYSTNGGESWTSSVLYDGGDATHTWIGVASDSTGRRLVANTTGYLIMQSTDGGISWSSSYNFTNGATTPTTTEPWYAISSSSNGARLCSVASGGRIWYADLDTYVSIITNTANELVPSAVTGLRARESVVSDTDGSNSRMRACLYVLQQQKSVTTIGPIAGMNSGDAAQIGNGVIFIDAGYSAEPDTGGPTASYSHPWEATASAYNGISGATEAMTVAYGPLETTRAAYDLWPGQQLNVSAWGGNPVTGLDFIICSDLINILAPLYENYSVSDSAIDSTIEARGGREVNNVIINLANMLKTGGLLVFSVPYSEAGTGYTESFPSGANDQLCGVDKWTRTGLPPSQVDITATHNGGSTTTYAGVDTNGSAGKPVVMRTFTKHSLASVGGLLNANGFDEPTLVTPDATMNNNWGIYWENIAGLVMYAAKTADVTV